MTYQQVTSDLPNERKQIDVAAEWLAAHRGECTGALIPQVRVRFSLTNLEAIEALKRSHVLRMARAM